MFHGSMCLGQKLVYRTESLRICSYVLYRGLWDRYRDLFFGFFSVEFGVMGYMSDEFTRFEAY